MNTIRDTQQLCHEAVDHTSVYDGKNLWTQCVWTEAWTITPEDWPLTSDLDFNTLNNSGVRVQSASIHSPVAGPITLFGLLTIVSLLFSIVLCVSMKFSPGGHSPPAWLFQNPRWPPWMYESIILHNVRSKYSIIALLVLIITFLTSMLICRCVMGVRIYV